jgi:hypothetical protein
MGRPVTADMRDPKTPASVAIVGEAQAPSTDPTCGVALPSPRGVAPAPKHRLVTIGDSLTHGFQSGAIYNTQISWPRLVAWEMGWDDWFRYPRYGGPGGLPLNLEYLLRRMEARFGAQLSWWELPVALFDLRQLMDEVEDYWERGPGATAPAYNSILHDLAVYGWDLRDCLDKTSGVCAARIGQPHDDFLSQIVQNANDRAALRVLPAAQAGGALLTVFGAATALGAEGTLETPGEGDGIETLVVMLGANNALGSVVHLQVKWSQAPACFDIATKDAFTVWDPDHFRQELALVAKEVQKIRARQVIFATVPHVTVAPIARGVGQAKVARHSRYFPYYTRPWISDGAFSVADSPHITDSEARAVDSAIDQYNAAIVATVKEQRAAGRDWYVLELAGLLDRLAQRRYIQDPDARPGWWTEYPLPPALAALKPPPTSLFFASDPRGRTAGGLFSLDGVHPTTVGYGIVAQEVIRIMELAGVTFYEGDGKTRRKAPVEVDFTRLIGLDTLISRPPISLTSDMHLLGWLDEHFGWVLRLFA